MNEVIESKLFDDGKENEIFKDALGDLLFDMFLSNSLYHGGAFTGILRIIFTLFIPSLLVGAVPVEVVRNMTQSNIIVLLSSSIFYLCIKIDMYINLLYNEKS